MTATDGDTPEEPSRDFSHPQDMDRRLRKLESRLDRSAGLEGRVTRLEQENRDCSEERIVTGSALKRVEEHLAEDRLERKEIHEDVQKIKSGQRALGFVLTALVAIVPVIIEVVKTWHH